MAAILIILIGFFTATCAQLPPEIRADAYLMQAEQTIRDGDHVPARTVIWKIRASKERHELDPPSTFYFRYSRTVDFVVLPEQALELVLKYLIVSSRKGEERNVARAQVE